MPRHVAFLRGVSPMNAKMPALKACFEAAGFSDVRTLRTLRSSGNLVFDARSSSPAALQRVLPIERDGARILQFTGAEVLCDDVPGPKGPAFMGLLEKTFGKSITTRTLDTVRKCAWA